MELNDAILACKSKDRAAQKHLYYTFAPELLTVARRYARNIVSPTDIVQEAFIQIFGSIDGFDPEKGSFRKWIKTITAYTAIKLNKKHSVSHSELYDHMEVNSKSVSAIDKMGEEEVLKLVQQLPDGFREVFNLYVIDGFSHKEIGEMLDIKEASSRSQLSRARIILKKRIEALDTKLKAI